MNRNALYVIIGGLVVVVAVLGFYFHQERQTTRVEINVGKDGLSIEKK